MRIHGKLIKEVLENLLLAEISITHVNGHQKGSSYEEATGNRIADVAAKEAACEDEIRFLNLTPNIPKISLIPKFSKKEIKKLQEVGASRDEKGQWTLPDGREMMDRPIMRELMNMLHRGSHWGPQAMCDALLKVYGCISIYTIAKQVCKSCITCQRITKINF